MELRQNSNSKLQSKYQQKLKRWLVGLEFTRKNNQNKNGSFHDLWLWRKWVSYLEMTTT